MPRKRPIALFILEGKSDRFDALRAAIPTPIEVLTVDTRLEAKVQLIRQPEIAFIGVATRDGFGIFVREFGILRLDGKVA
ncbi:MAG: hypothetical protein UT91_C0011G0041 [Parcubacteria group bacterium GW2011_GWA2_40_23]|nr:MAG: hypothetical protein UT91_C0011G0041 [Parcubacteria group bacterium GW2011_GWA2_40_23]